MYRPYTPQDRQALFTDLNEIGATEVCNLERALEDSASVWVMERRGRLMAVGGLVVQTLLSDECFAWLVCTRACNARYMRWITEQLLGRYRVVHVALDPAKPKAVRFATWLGFQLHGTLPDGFDHYVLRRAA